ncbi:DMT family transporter [uncultured Hoeflea sp.]|uniref:DMT family transporter n=1 Tax=uncultured Hoeflea sp. TaxID=538666 RepID=UPI0030DBCA7C|tara:strand:- start:942 stop:1844 length:903 start_codon:yes stop_codon:yes gene_type:complete
MSGIAASAHPDERPWLGAALRVLAGLLFAAMSICGKSLSGSTPLGEIVFFRSLFALIPLAAFLWLRSELPSGLATRKPLGHLLRSVLGAAAMFASFAAIARLPLAEATLLGYLAPIFTALAGVFILSERMTAGRAGGVIIGFCGVVVLFWPELSGGQMSGDRLLGYGLGLLTGVLTAFALIMVRRLNRTESAGAIAFYFILTSMIGGLATLSFGWVTPDLTGLVLLVMAGIFGGLAHIASTVAFRNAEASFLAPFDYFAIIWPLLADLLLFNQPVSSAFIVALPLVLAGGAITVMGRKKF